MADANANAVGMRYYRAARPQARRTSATARRAIAKAEGRS